MDDWNTEPARACPRCGAPNWPDALRCASCGAFLPHADDQEVIDVTTGRPQVVRDDERARPAPTGWTDTVTAERGRVFVAGGRGCLLALVVFTLLSCCVCWALWSGVSGFSLS